MKKLLAKIVIRGRPRSKKNGKIISCRGKHPVVVSSKVYRAWEDQAIMQVRQQWGDKPPLEGDLIADARIYQDKGQAIDATNALEGPWDVLEACGVIRNDYQLSSGSWVRYRDADDPRIEINLYKES